MTASTRQRAAYALLLGALAIGPIAFGAVEAWSWAIVSCMIAAACLLTAGDREADPYHPVLRLLLPGVSALVVLGVLQRLNPRPIDWPASFAPFTASPWATSNALRHWAVYALLLWCAPRVIRGTAGARRVAFTLLLLGVGLSLAGIIQGSQGNNWIYGFRRVPAGYEAFGSYYNRDHAASFLLMSLFAGLGLLADRFESFRDRAESLGIYDFAASQVVVICGIATILTGMFYALSRGALLALAGTAVLFALVTPWYKRYRLLIVLGVFLIAMVALNGSPITRRISGKLLGSAFLERMTFWHGAVGLVRDFPVFGVGLGAFQQAYHAYQPASVIGLLEHLHCDWLELLVEAGWAGGVFYFLSLVRFYWRCYCDLFLARGKRSWGLAFGFGAAAVAFSVHGLVDFGFQTPANATAFFFVLVELGSLTRPRDLATARIPIPACAVAFLTAAAIAFAVMPPALASVRYLQHTGDVAYDRASLSAAAATDQNPRYASELALHEAPLEQLDAGTPALRHALADADRALAQDPTSPRFRYLEGNLLWRLGRVSDGAALIGK